MKFPTALTIFLLFIWGQTVSAQDLPLSCKIVNDEVYKLDRPILIEFAVTNNSDRDIQLLPWGTPLEGFFSRALKVSYQGSPLDYQGPLLKRGAPQSDDYIQIKAKSTVTKQLDLTSAYQFTEKGTYQLHYDGMIQSWYFVSDTTNSSNKDEQQFTDLCCPSVSFTLE